MAPSHEQDGLSPSLKAVQDRAVQSPRDETMQRFEEQQRKGRAHNGPAILTLLAIALVALALGVAIGAILHGRPELDPLMDPTLLLLAIVVLASVALFLAMLARTQRVLSRGYPRRTSGVVSSSRISNKAGGTTGTSGHRINYVHCTVTYEVAGQQYTVSWKPGGSISSVEKYLGTVVPVCVDADQPGDAIVGRPDRSFLKLGLAYGFFAALTGACIYLREYPLF